MVVATVFDIMADFLIYLIFSHIINQRDDYAIRHRLKMANIGDQFGSILTVVEELTYW